MSLALFFKAIAIMTEITPPRTSHRGEFGSLLVSLAMPPCFVDILATQKTCPHVREGFPNPCRCGSSFERKDQWCQNFDDLLRTKSQKK